MQVDSSKMPHILAQSSAETLESARHVMITSAPADDLAEPDFLPRVLGLVTATKSLASLVICIPSMARLHPSNSLPKVLDVLHEVFALRPECELGLIVHEAEQAWGASTILKRIVELQLPLKEMEFSKTFFPVEALFHAGRICGLERLSLHDSQISSSSPLIAASAISTPDISIPTLRSLTAHIHSDEASSSGLGLLLRASAGSLTRLHLSLTSSSNGIGGGFSSNSEKNEGLPSAILKGHNFPHLIQLELHEALLSGLPYMRMPLLKDLAIKTLTQIQNCNVIREIATADDWLQLQNVRISRIVAGDVSDMLTQIEKQTRSEREDKTHLSSKITIGELAVGDPARVTPATLALCEHLVNAGPPLISKWPLEGFKERHLPLLRSIVLKVFEGGNLDEFLALLEANAPSLSGKPIISVIKSKKKAGKGGKG